MRREAFRITVLATALGVLVMLVSMMRTSGQQSSMLGPLDAKEPIPYFIGDGNGHTGYRASDRELAQWALQAWQRSASGSLQFKAAEESSALIRLYWSEPSDGQYGETLPLRVEGKRGASVFIRPDMEALGPDIARRAGTDALLRDSIVYLTCLHELGHALGLEHTRDFRDIMYFFGYGGDVVEYFNRYRAQVRSRGDLANVSGLSDGDVKRIRSLYPRE